MSKVGAERWHTTRRENPRNYEMPDTPAIWARITSAIIDHQNKHGGASPSDRSIAENTLLSIGQVQYHLREMANAQVITVLGDYPRVIAVHQITKPTKEPPKEAAKEEAMHITGTVKRTFNGPDGREHEMKPFIVRAKDVALALEEYWRDHGEGPPVLWLQERVFGFSNTSTGSATRIVQQMVERGWVTHKKGYVGDTKLTEEGRKVLLGTAITQPEPQPDKGKQLGGRKAFMVRAHDVAVAIKDIVDRTGEPASVRELTDMVYGPGRQGTGGMSAILKKMVAEGWIKHKPKHQKDIMLTGAGRAALFNDIAEDVATDMPVSALPEYSRDDEAMRWGAPRSPEALAPRKPPGATIPREVPPRRDFAGDAYVQEASHHQTPPRMRAAVAMDNMERYSPPPTPLPETVPPVERASDLDLILELNRRGYKVSR
jgi:predicted transcriptional regulator/DNA-binding transcriptional regulator YhcF (GntR family)